VQIDHMTVTKNGLCLKHFQAWDRRSKFIEASLYAHAKSSAAKQFLLELIRKVPFKLLSIQVDGGSEFRADFEQACAELEIPLIVLPPKKPMYNGGVERGNRTFREEFYNKPTLLAHSIGDMRAELTKALHKYNTYRPHRNLKGLTPMQYIQSNYLEA
jgi:putative transposase